MIHRVLQFSKRSYLENEMINVFQDICCIQQTSMISIASQIIITFMNLVKALHLWLCIYPFKSVLYVVCNLKP